MDHAKVPVTVKIRTGWDADSVNAREVALYAEDAGISALFIHGRTKTQGYSGTVDYRQIKEVKDALKVPVIASGDNISAPLIKKMFDETGCDGVAIARGALGNPWIFREAARFFQDQRRSNRTDDAGDVIVPDEKDVPGGDSLDVNIIDPHDPWLLVAGERAPDRERFLIRNKLQGDAVQELLFLVGMDLLDIDPALLGDVERVDRVHAVDKIGFSTPCATDIVTGMTLYFVRMPL